MIVSVTLNPAYDRTVTVQEIKVGESNPIVSVRSDPGGKGINVSRVVKELGRDTVALGLLGGDTGEFILRSLNKMELKSDFVSIKHSTRTNLTITSLSSNIATEFNHPGPNVSEAELIKLEALIFKYLADASLVVFSGSLPPGLPDDTYRRLINLVEKRGKRTVLDTRGKALVEGIKETPYLIKPNRYEAESLLGRKLNNLEEVIRAGRDLLNEGTQVAVISMGKEGSILITREEVWQAIPPQVQVKSGVGAGDTLVAGLCIGVTEKMGWEETLKLATAASAATCMREGTQLAVYEDVLPLIDKVQVKRLK